MPEDLPESMRSCLHELIAVRTQAKRLAEDLVAARLSMTMLEDTRHEERQYRDKLEKRIAELVLLVAEREGQINILKEEVEDLKEPWSDY